MEGLPEVPDWRPSPMQGRAVTPALISWAGGRMLTTSAAPGWPIGPEPRITSTERSVMFSAGSSMRWW